MLNIGDNAPDFCLETDTNGTISLANFKGKNIVLFFYPKDNTPGCTVEAQDFTATKGEFEHNNCVTIGISADSIKKHKNFREKHNLNIILASDEDHVALEAYNVWQTKKNYGKEYMGIVRTSFLINIDGKIIDIWHKVRVKGHVQNVLDRLIDHIN